MRLPLFLLVFTFCTPLSTAYAQTHVADAPGVLAAKGPLPTRNYEPLNAPFLLPLPVDASVLGRNRSRYDANLDFVNNLLTVSEADNRRYNTDFEEQRLLLGYARGIGRGQEVGIRLPLIARNGGVLDKVITVWHNLFGLEGGGRGDLPDYKTLYQVNNANGQNIIDSNRGTIGVGDIVMEYRRELSPVSAEEVSLNRLAASARAFLKMPTGNSNTLLGSGNADVGAGIALSVRPNRRFALHSNLNLVLTGNPRNKNLQVSSTRFHFLVTAEYLLNGRTSFVAQTDDTPAPFRSGINYADRPRRNFSAGVWHEVNNSNRLYLALGENDFSAFAKHAPDFTLSLGLRRTR